MSQLVLLSFSNCRSVSRTLQKCRSAPSTNLHLFRVRWSTWRANMNSTTNGGTQKVLALFLHTFLVFHGVSLYSTPHQSDESTWGLARRHDWYKALPTRGQRAWKPVLSTSSSVRNWSVKPRLQTLLARSQRYFCFGDQPVAYHKGSGSWEESSWKMVAL